MSFSLELSQIQALIGGVLINGDYQFTHLSTDTRNIEDGDVFLALCGAFFDGHSFCMKAIEQGAKALIVDREMETNLPQLIVEDTHLALGSISKLNRRKFAGPLIAVTGSNGKTTTKEMIAEILRQKGVTLATKGNLNNDIGVPLTLLDFEQTHEFAIVEMGANAKGEIAYCTALAEPQVAVITNAMGAHLEGFGSLQGVVEAKSEIFQGLDDDGVAILNLDDKNVGFWQDINQKRRCITFSLNNPQADVFATEVEQLESGCYRFHLNYLSQSIEVSLQLLAVHNVRNALAAAAAAFAIGATLSEVGRGLMNVKAVTGRLKPMPLKKGGTLIDDSYNGNPDSVKAGIDLLSGLKGKQFVVLGDMGELGPDELALHQSVGYYAAEKNIDGFFSCGPKGRLAATAFSDETGKEPLAFNSKEEMIKKIKTMIEADTKILVKGSLSAGMKDVVTALTQEVSE